MGLERDDRIERAAGIVRPGGGGGGVDMGKRGTATEFRDGLRELVWRGRRG